MVRLVQVGRVSRVGRVVRIIRVDAMHSENIWLSWSKPSNYR